MLTLRMTAEQVIGHLTSARFSANTMTRRFLFRGQRDATWDVIPRVVRTPSPFEGEINTLGDQLNAEELALLRFLDAAHQALDTANTFIPLNKNPKFSDRIEKITFPRAEARSLLKRLHDLRVNGARLFPGYDGARRAERERMLWERG